MKKLKKLLKRKAHVALSVPAVLCFITFITNLFKALEDRNIDTNELHALLASADGFETTILFVIMLLIRDKK